MPRALALRYVTVAGGGRAAYLARLAERTAGARATGVHFWAFEQVGDGGGRAGTAGRFVEFVEAADPRALDTALVQDELLGESLDFRHEPPAATPWERFAGLPGSS